MRLACRAAGIVLPRTSLDDHIYEGRLWCVRFYHVAGLALWAGAERRVNPRLEGLRPRSPPSRVGEREGGGTAMLTGMVNIAVFAAF